jgi:hypothetical protein
MGKDLRYAGRGINRLGDHSPNSFALFHVTRYLEANFGENGRLLRNKVPAEMDGPDRRDCPTNG